MAIPPLPTSGSGVTWNAIAFDTQNDERPATSSGQMTPLPITNNLFGTLAHHCKWRSFFLMTRFVTEYLGQGQQELSQLLNELQGELQVLHLARNLESTAARLRGLSKKIRLVLHTHIEQQEQILYPALEGHMQGIAATLERMRRENDVGEVEEQAFFQCVEQWARSGKNRQEVMKRGRNYVQWVRGHLLKENGRLFPLVERGLDAETQQKVRRAMEELSLGTSSRVAEGTLSAQA
jgi:iron-sulfur cluster repair protein YtfE (RIC family)